MARSLDVSLFTTFHWRRGKASCDERPNMAEFGPLSTHLKKQLLHQSTRLSISGAIWAAVSTWPSQNQVNGVHSHCQVNEEIKKSSKFDRKSLPLPLRASSPSSTRESVTCFSQLVLERMSKKDLCPTMNQLNSNLSNSPKFDSWFTLTERKLS